MAESTPDPSPAAADETTAEVPGWGRLLDAAGIAAGVLLVIIVADIVTDGRLVSRRLHRRNDDDSAE